MTDEKQLRGIVIGLEEEYGSRADDAIMQKDWPLSVKEQALSMVRKKSIDSALVEEGELNPEELKD